MAVAPNDEAVLRIGGGATEGDGNYFFEGDVDEVSYYNKVLPEDRILAHYLAGLPSQTNSPSLTVTLASGKVTLTWSSGTLQEANDVLGAWQDVPNATSPMSITPAGDRKFYRLK